jgi:predicted alpha/beta superfamily hydrolase
MKLITFLLLIFFVSPLVYSQQQPTNFPAVSYRNTEHRTLASQSVGDTFQLYVSLPDGYNPDSGKLYPVVYLTDADYSFGMSKDIANYLQWGKKIPAHILVGIAYGGDVTNWGMKRQRDFLPVANKDIYLSGGAPKFAEFLQAELIPFIDKTYKTKHGDRALIGMSYGGVFASYMLFQHPRVFKRYIIGTTYFGYENNALYGYEKAYAEQRKEMPAKVYLSIGGAERYALKQFESFNQQFKSRNYKGLDMKYEVLPDEVHESVGSGTLARGLRWIYEGHTYEGKVFIELTPAILDQYIGNYAAGKFNVTIYRNATKLILRIHKDNSEMELSPESKTLFFSKEENFQLEFTREGGVITGFTILGEKNMHFKKVTKAAAQK